MVGGVDIQRADSSRRMACDDCVRDGFSHSVDHLPVSTTPEGHNDCRSLRCYGDPNSVRNILGIGDQSFLQWNEVQGVASRDDA